MGIQYNVERERPVTVSHDCVSNPATPQSPRDLMGHAENHDPNSAARLVPTGGHEGLISASFGHCAVIQETGVVMVGAGASVTTLVVCGEIRLFTCMDEEEEATQSFYLGCSPRGSLGFFSSLLTR